MSKQRILLEIDLDQLKDIVRQAVRDELSVISRNNNQGTVTKSEACRRLNFGYKRLITLIQKGVIAVTPDGRIPIRSIEEYLTASQKEV